MFGPGPCVFGDSLDSSVNGITSFCLILVAAESATRAAAVKMVFILVSFLVFNY